MRDSEILSRVRTLIRTKECRAICMALDRVGMREYIAYTQIMRLKLWVRKMLQGCVYYEDWLLAHHSKVMRTMTVNDFRKGRIQWLDWMIAECKKKEPK